MKTELIIALLGMACIGSLAAFFVAWAKADEYKHMAKEEHANYLSAKQLHNTVCGLLERSEDQQKCSANAVIWLADELKRAKAEAKVYRANFESCRNGNKVLQDRLSALLCPSNNHIWKDGVCVKCGRVKDD